MDSEHEQEAGVGLLIHCLSSVTPTGASEIWRSFTECQCPSVIAFTEPFSTGRTTIEASRQDKTRDNTQFSRVIVEVTC
jgi:hypothetical protein